MPRPMPKSYVRMELRDAITILLQAMCSLDLTNNGRLDFSRWLRDARECLDRAEKGTVVGKKLTQ